MSIITYEKRTNQLFDAVGKSYAFTYLDYNAKNGAHSMPIIPVKIDGKEQIPYTILSREDLRPQILFLLQVGTIDFVEAAEIHKTVCEFLTTETKAELVEQIAGYCVTQNSTSKLMSKLVICNCGSPNILHCHLATELGLETFIDLDTLVIFVLMSLSDEEISLEDAIDIIKTAALTDLSRS